MAKIQEMMFQIGAALQNTVPQAFNQVNRLVGMTQAKLAVFSRNTNPFANTNKDLAKFQVELDKARKRENDLEQSFGRLGVRTTNLRKELARAESVHKTLAQQMKAIDSPSKQQERNFQNSEIKVHKLNFRLGELQQNLLKTNSELKNQSGLVKNLETSYGGKGKRPAAKQIFNEHRNKVDSSLQNAANSMLLARNTVAMSHFMLAPIKEAMKFESVMADIRKLVHFDTPQQFAEMGEQLKLLSSRVPMSVEGLGHIAAAAAQAGIAKNDILQFTENAAQMGVAYNIAAEQAGDMMAKWRSAFKLSQIDVVKLADQVNILSDNSAATGVQIGEVVSRIGALGKIAGIAESEIAALAATSIGAGVAPEIAATGIKKLMTTLTSGKNATKGQAEALGQLGVNVIKLSKDLQTKGVPAILDVLDKIKQLPKEAQSSTLKQIFGEESIAPIAGLMNNLDEVKKNLHLVGDSTKYAGSMMREFNARSATTENTLQLFHNNIAAISITMGNTFLPSINKAIQTVNQYLSNTVMPFIGAHQESITIIGGVAAGLTALCVSVAVTKAAFAGLTAVWQVGYGALRILGNTLLWFIPQQARAWMATKLMAYWQGILNVAMRANPIIRIVTGIIALGSAIYWVCTHWEVFTEWIRKALEMIKETFGWVGQLTGAIASLFDGNDGKRKLEIDYELKNSSRFAGNVESLANNQKDKSRPNMTLNSNPTLIIQGNADKDTIRSAMSQSQTEQGKQLEGIWKSARFANS